MRKNTDAGVPALASETSLQKLDAPVTSENLPKNVSLQLFDLMKQVVADDVNPKTVLAACKCATEIHRMLKLNQEIRRYQS